MPASCAINHKFQGRVLAALIVATTLSGCASAGMLGKERSPTAIGPGAAVEKGLSLAVWLEDQCESEEKDAETLTVLEGFHDGLVIPMEMLSAITVVTVVGTVWSLYDRLMLPANELLPDRPGMIMAYVKPHRAGPIREKEEQTNARSIVWHGCLSR